MKQRTTWPILGCTLWWIAALAIGAAGLSSVVSAATPDSTALFPVLAKFREATKKGDSDAALRVLDRSAEKFNGGNEGLLRLLRGRTFERQSVRPAETPEKTKDKVTERQLAALAEYAEGAGSGTAGKNLYEAHLRFSIAKVAAGLNRADEAKAALTALLTTSLREAGDVPQAMKLQAVHGYAEQLAKAEKWKDAIRLLQPAMKRSKGSDVYPSLVYSLFRAKRHTGVSDCRLARDLYAKYPALPQLSDWGPLLPENKIDGLKPSCSATTKDIQSRLRRLQLAGQVDRSADEIHLLRDRGAFDLWTIASMDVNALLAQGKNEDAMKALLKSAKENSSRPAFWMLLGKIASRLGDFAGSAGAYKQAYNLAPSGRASSDALFNSAFASYQMQDYDGAQVGFEKLSRKFGRSKVARDARWHLAWMSYLRHEYASALEGWEGLLRERAKSRRGRTSGDAVMFDRIQYWSAMALLQLGRVDEAGERLRQLIRNPAIEYYSILAWYRMQTTPGIKLSESEKHLIFKSVAEGAAAESSYQPSVEGDSSADAVDEAAVDGSSDEAAGETTSEIASEVATGEAGTVEDMAGNREPIPSASVRDPALQRRLERVRLLFAAGLEEETRWELQNLDQRVRHPQDRRTMMAELHRMGRWDRSSTLAELTFAAPRLKGGLDGARDLWEFAFPRAWLDVVQSASRSVSVDEDLVWGIMRAESHYRPEARSPVGASGLMQIMPFTGERVAVDLLGRKSMQNGELFDPETNIRIGSRYLKRLAEKFSSRVPLIAAGYNAGPHRVQTWLKGFGNLTMDAFIEHIPFIETRNYVKKVVRNYQTYRLLYRDDRGSLTWLVGPVGVQAQDGPGAFDVW